MAQFPAQTLPRPEIYSSNLDISEFFNRTFVYLPAVNGIEKTKIKTKEAGNCQLKEKMLGQDGTMSVNSITESTSRIPNRAVLQWEKVMHYLPSASPTKTPFVCEGNFR